jgi:hypothetical protein
MDGENGDVVHRIEITGNLSRHDVEELYLELGRLVKRYAARIEEFQFEKLRDHAIGNEEP